MGGKALYVLSGSSGLFNEVPARSQETTWDEGLELPRFDDDWDMVTICTPVREVRHTCSCDWDGSMGIYIVDVELFVGTLGVKVGAT